MLFKTIGFIGISWSIYIILFQNTLSFISENLNYKLLRGYNSKLSRFILSRTNYTQLPSGPIEGVSEIDWYLEALVAQWYTLFIL